MTNDGNTPPAATENEKNGLKRSLGLWDTLLFGVGTMLGAGIYAIIGEAAGSSGNLLWTSFLIAAAIAFLTGLTYSEFVSRFPDAGGSFEYIKQSFGTKTAYVAGILIFLTGIVAAAAIAISFADYLSRLVDIPQWIAVASIIALMGGVNIIGVQSSAGFNAFATTVTVLGLLAVVVTAIPDWGTKSLVQPPSDGTVGVLIASALIFFSFVGFEDLVKMAEETKEPRSTLPKALLLATLIVLIIYLLVAISATSVLGGEKLGSSKGPLSAVMEARTGQMGALALAVVALFATSKTILSNILGTSRLLYDISRDSNQGWLKKLTHIVERFGTPVAAIILVTALAILFGLIGNLSLVASISNLFILSVFTVVNIGLVVWRVRNPDAEDPPFRVPISVGKVPVLPCIGAGATLTMFGFNLYSIIG